MNTHAHTGSLYYIKKCSCNTFVYAPDTIADTEIALLLDFAAACICLNLTCHAPNTAAVRKVMTNRQRLDTEINI